MLKKVLIAAVPLALLVGCGSSSGSVAAPTPTETIPMDTYLPTGPVPSGDIPSDDPSTVPPVAVPTPDVKTLITAWAQGGGLNKIGALTSALSNVGASGTSGDVTATRAACIQLTTAVSAAKDYEPIPDAAVQQHWVAGLDDLGTASINCVAGIDSGSASLIGDAGNEETQGTAELSDATTLLNAL